MKLLKNRFFVTVVAVAVILCLVPTVLAVSGHTDIVRSALTVVSTPFRAAFNFIADGVSGFFEYFKGVDRLIDENEKLKAELEEYKASVFRADLAEGENAWLREQLDFVGRYSDCTFVDARITGHSSNSYSETFTLNRGTESGVAVGMAVVTSEGVAGYIKETGLGYSRAVALTDPTAAVGVCTKSGIYGTVCGSVSERQSGLCVLERVAVSGLSGEMLYSTGYGGIFPPGLAVGKIVGERDDTYTHTFTYTVEPAVDLASARGVLIVTSVTAKTEDADG